MRPSVTRRYGPDHPSALRYPQQHFRRVGIFSTQRASTIQKMEQTESPHEASSLGITGRPDKPSGFPKESHSDESLTFHHKYNAQKILDDLAKVIEAKDRNHLLTMYEFAGLSGPSEDFIQQLFGSKERSTDFSAKFEKFKEHVVWAQWNGFFGPSPKSTTMSRIDDPRHDLDRHVTGSGSLTPRTQLAHDIADAGGLSEFDWYTLHERLEALKEKGPSTFDIQEWDILDVDQKQGWNYQGKLYAQKGNTQAHCRILELVKPKNHVKQQETKVIMTVVSNRAADSVEVSIHKKSLSGMWEKAQQISNTDNKNNNNNNNTSNNVTTTDGIRRWRFTKDNLDWGDYIVEVRGVNKQNECGPVEQDTLTVQQHRSEEEKKQFRKEQADDDSCNLGGFLFGQPD